MAVSVRFRCTACHVERMVAKHLVGRRVRCPECGNLVKVSAESTTRPEEPATTTWNPPDSTPGTIPPPPESALAGEEFEGKITPIPPPIVNLKEPTALAGDSTDSPTHEESSEEEAWMDEEDIPESDDEETGVSFASSYRAGEGEMDMTPMVDVTFLLLIFFMVTASFAMQRSIPMPTPQESEPSTEVRTLDDYMDDEDYVVVRIDAYSTYHIFAQDWDKEAPSAHELRIQLKRARNPSGNQPVPNRLLVVANGDALYEKVVTALDAGTGAGMENVQLITVEDDEE